MAVVGLVQRLAAVVLTFALIWKDLSIVTRVFESASVF